MPVMDGFEVLEKMNKNHWIEDIPVIMISSEDSAAFDPAGLRYWAFPIISAVPLTPRWSTAGL